jgi:hypothetical protein
MRCDAHALALALAPGLFCSLCLVPLREVLQVKLKLLACAIAVAALVVGQHVRPRRFTSTGVAQWPNCKEQGCRDRPASRPLQAWAGTVSHIRDSDAKFGAGQGEVQGRVNAMGGKGGGRACCCGLAIRGRESRQSEDQGKRRDHHDSDASGAATYHRSRI